MRACSTKSASFVLLTCLIWAAFALALAPAAFAQATDGDLDGVFTPADCDDANPNIPGAVDIPGNGIDEDCVGGDAPLPPADADGDGFNVLTDCNDGNRAVYPGAPEVPENGVDEDCNGSDALNDGDGDGFSRTRAPLDCNDGNAAINPGAAEVPGNDVDENCNGVKADIDNDGFNSYGTPRDCNDRDPSINPGARDVPGDGIDQDCSGADARTDADADGFGPPQDCNDMNAAINPGARDVPRDGIDQDCSGADARMDADADGFGPPQDCNDTNAAINPGARDVVGNGVDEDCSGRDGAPAPTGAAGEVLATPPAVLARRLYAVVRVRGATTRRGARLTSITVDAPRGSKVRLLCGRRSCRAHRVARSATITTFTRFRRTFRAGQTVRVLITRPGMIGRYVRLKIRRGRPPLRQDLCLASGSVRPVRCA